MGKTASKTKPVVDEIVASKVAKAWALHESLGPRGFEKITPPVKLSNKAKPIRNPKFNPIETAEKHLKQMSVSYKLWLHEDEEKLRSAFNSYVRNPADKSRFECLNACIHTIKGNAPILGFDAAGMIAAALTDLTERCTEYEKFTPVLALSLRAIYQMIEHNPPLDNPELTKTIATLHKLRNQCDLEKKKKPRAKNNFYAAGKANCAACTQCPSSGIPSATCLKSSCNSN